MVLVLKRGDVKIIKTVSHCVMSCFDAAITHGIAPDAIKIGRERIERAGGRLRDSNRMSSTL